ncbi:hypothetical protein ACWCQJ_20960 [Streptomyces olivaceus]|uniref:hypothetical protein n=1 Tax=Streptomyces olivaceus TaxID=47716 RepID=UPI001CCCCB2A|nr:hypothetical protein [Streptomyces olivaceus]MBZ6295953.1 hypothetical protein [Streptomyces olivaceus]MBZ6330645.1 hypothetical protein [Streptomyces olivaceus]
MPNEQRDQQTQAPAVDSQPNARREFAKKSAITMAAALVSGAAREVVAHLFTDGE